MKNLLKQPISILKLSNSKNQKLANRKVEFQDFRRKELRKKLIQKRKLRKELNEYIKEVTNIKVRSLYKFRVAVCFSKFLKILLSGVFGPSSPNSRTANNCYSEFGVPCFVGKRRIRHLL